MQYNTSPLTDLFEEEGQVKSQEDCDTLLQVWQEPRKNPILDLENLLGCTENVVADLSEYRQDEVAQSNANHVTSHGSDSAATMTDEETLAIYTPVILNRLRSSKRDLARVGADLCKAKNDLAKGSDLSRERETTFTKWYEDVLGISQDQARLWMRWTRPVLGIVNWEDDDDPILNEMASIGPHLFDEVTKLPEDFWFMSDEGILFVAAAATGDKDIAVKEFSVRKIKAIRDRIDSLDDGDNENNADAESLLEVNTDLVEEVEGDSLNDSDSKPDSKFNDDADSDEEEEDGGSDENTNARSNTKFDADIKGSISLSKKKNTTAKSRTKKSQKPNLDNFLNADDWSHKDFQPFKLPVLHGKTEGDNPMYVSGINVKITRESNAWVHAVVDDTQDAFYAVKTGTDLTLHWYDHREDHWYEATVEQLPSEQHDCNEPVLEPQEPPMNTQDELETGSCDLGDLDAYWDETDTLELEEHFDAYVEEDTVV